MNNIIRICDANKFMPMINYLQDITSINNIFIRCFLHMKSRMNSYQEFLSLQKEHQLLSLPTSLDAMLDHLQYLIHSKLDKNSKQQYRFKKRKHDLTNEHRQALSTLSIDQKLEYYHGLIKMILQYFQGKLVLMPILSGAYQGDGYARSYNIKKWKHKILRLQKNKCVLYAERQSKIKTYNLVDYILRKSKNTDYHSLVLQAINKKPHEKSRTVHFGFKQEQQLNRWYSQLLQVFHFLQNKLVISALSDNSAIIKRLTNSEVIAQKEKKINQSKGNSSESDDDANSRISKSVYFEELPQKKQEEKEENTKKQNISVQKQAISDLKKEEDQDQSDDDEEEDQVLLRGRRKTIIETIEEFGPDELEEMSEHDQAPNQGQQRENVFQRIFPQYKLNQITNMINFSVIPASTDPVRVYSDNNDPLHLKFYLLLENNKVSADDISVVFCNSELLKSINPEVQEFSLKTLIRSQNSALIYMKIKPYNRLYRARDFVFLRHVFKAKSYNENNQIQEITYIADKSIENINYPPFTTIVRGELTNILSMKKTNKGVQVIGDIKMKNNGYLKESQDVNLVAKYFGGFKEFGDKVTSLTYSENTIGNYKVFSLDWLVAFDNFSANFPKKQKIQQQQSPESFKKKKSEHPQQKITQKTVQENKKSAKLIKKQEIQPQKKKSEKKQKQEKDKKVDKIKDEVKEEKKEEKKIEFKEEIKDDEDQMTGELDISQIEEEEKNIKNTVHLIHRQFDKQGYVIIEKGFIKNKYVLQPLPKGQPHLLESVHGHHIWKGDWKHDDKVGGIIFINQKKIQDQKGVLKFILTKIGKNILSGKSVMNISLPVDIFTAESNLETMLYSFSYAPIKIEPYCSSSLLQRLKNTIAFGISNSPLYLNMEKPFNPILGETFQCFIDGCPGYAEQISHHPPIAAMIFKGRGYEITVQVQSKVQLHMNSGCGTNEGIFRIKFDDGAQCCYITPGGQVSGLTYGDRKFNMVGKSYYWTEGKQSQSESLFVQLVFNPSQKGFFGGKQEKPIDYLQGTICRVKREFITQFLAKKKGPSQKQILEKVGRVHGIWNQYVNFENECILDLDKEIPPKLEYQANPLPSDANWRQDIAYRRLMQITRAQAQKQRLQVLQRQDRKLREKVSGKKH